LSPPPRRSAPRHSSHPSCGDRAPTHRSPRSTDAFPATAPPWPLTPPAHGHAQRPSTSP
jgi:hypothetical protein